MRHLRKRKAHGLAHGSPEIRMQPSYHSEISADYIRQMQAKVDAEKPADFRLTAITEAGW